MFKSWSFVDKKKRLNSLKIKGIFNCLTFIKTYLILIYELVEFHYAMDLIYSHTFVIIIFFPGYAKSAHSPTKPLSSRSLKCVRRVSLTHETGVSAMCVYTIFSIHPVCGKIHLIHNRQVWPYTSCEI